MEQDRPLSFIPRLGLVCRLDLGLISSLSLHVSIKSLCLSQNKYFGPVTTAYMYIGTHTVLHLAPPKIH